MRPSETGKPCKDCGRNTPWTDWDRCEACVDALYDALDELRDERAGMTMDEARREGEEV